MDPNRQILGPPRLRQNSCLDARRMEWEFLQMQNPMYNPHGSLLSLSDSGAPALAREAPRFLHNCPAFGGDVK